MFWGLTPDLSQKMFYAHLIGKHYFAAFRWTLSYMSVKIIWSDCHLKSVLLLWMLQFSYSVMSSSL